MRSKRITCISGTPGTGKSTVANLLSQRGYPVIEIKDFARARGVYSYIDNGETLVVEIPDLVKALKAFLCNKCEMIIVGHLSHHLPEATAIVVLRTRPDKLEERLLGKGWTKAKVAENVEAEALDICLGEAVDLHGEKVSEIDTTDMLVDVTLDRILKVHKLGHRFPPRTRDWLLEHILKESKG